MSVETNEITSNHEILKNQTERGDTSNKTSHAITSEQSWEETLTRLQQELKRYWT